MGKGVEYGGMEKLIKLPEAMSFTAETGHAVASGDKETGKAALTELMNSLESEQ